MLLAPTGLETVIGQSFVVFDLYIISLISDSLLLPVKSVLSKYLKRSYFGMLISRINRLCGAVIQSVAMNFFL